jgi:hypothetical protein
MELQDPPDSRVLRMNNAQSLVSRVLRSFKQKMQEHGNECNRDEIQVLVAHA